MQNGIRIAKSPDGRTFEALEVGALFKIIRNGNTYIKTTRAGIAVRLMDGAYVEVAPAELVTDIRTPVTLTPRI